MISAIEVAVRAILAASIGKFRSNSIQPFRDTNFSPLFPPPVWLLFGFALFIACCSRDNGNNSTSDTTPPADVENFMASGGDTQMTLSWTNKGDSDFAGVMIRRATATAPATPADGTAVFDGYDTTMTDIGLTNFTEYFYTAFAYDTVDNFAEGVSASDVPQPPGSLDITFGGDVNPADGTPDGFITHTSAAGGPGEDWGKSVVLDSMGRILVAGVSTNATDQDMALWRFNSDGVLDTTFNSPNGFVIHHNAGGWGGSDVGTDVAVDSKGRIVVTGYSQSVTSEDMVLWRYNSDGTLDTTFGGDVNPADGTPDGFVVHDGAAGGTSADDQGYDVVIDGSDKILVAGYSTSATLGGEVTVWRYTSVGVLDGTFGGDTNPADGTPDGFVTHGIDGGSGNHDGGWAMALDGSGRIIVAGYGSAATASPDMALWRFTAAGVLDTSFNSPNGYLVHNDAAGGNLDERGVATVVDSMGRILVAGVSMGGGGNRDMVLWRYTSAGVLDTTFGGDVNPADGTPDGFVVHDGAANGTGDDWGHGIALDSQERIVVAGRSTGVTFYDMALWRFK